MATHDVALEELRRILNSITRDSKYAADRSIWLRDNIRYDTDRGRTPEARMVKELDEMTEKVKFNYTRIHSLTASIAVLEADNASEITHLTTVTEDEVFCIATQRYGISYDAGDLGPDHNICSECGAILSPDVLGKEQAHGA